MPRSAAFGMADAVDLIEPSDGAGDDSLGGVIFVCARDTENRVVRCEKNEPIPAPQVDTAGIESAGGGGGVAIFEPIRLSGRMPAGGGCGEDSGEENTLSDSRPERMLLASDLETLTMLLEALPACGAAMSDDELELRCIHRSRTLSTALKKPVDPAVIVRETASRAGASCCSSLSSCMPSVSRRPMSATTDGRSVHGCLRSLVRTALRDRLIKGLTAAP